jgi:hypothetical protein
MALRGHGGEDVDSIVACTFQRVAAGRPTFGWPVVQSQLHLDEAEVARATRLARWGRP